MRNVILLAWALVVAGACVPERSNPLDPKGTLRRMPNRPPQLDLSSPPAVAEGSTLVVVVAAVDPDGDDVVVTASDLPPNASFVDGVLRFAPDYGQAGSYTVTFTATDPAALAGSGTVTLVVDDETSAGCVDEDGDGHAAVDALACPAGDDCDDRAPAVHPGAAEVACNRVDDDCNATTPDDPDPTDADLDQVTLGCGDCDDTAAEVHPGAAEVLCNLRDDDCDPNTADNPDLDHDLFGVCVDCNDDDATIHPRAARVCDGGDHDCDGVTDAGCP